MPQRPPMGVGVVERFATKDGVRDALVELATSTDARNAPAQLFTLLGKLADWARQHRWLAAHWLEGDMVVEIGPSGRGVSLVLSSNLGFGLCAPVFPAIQFDNVPFADLEWIAENVPELASPLATMRGLRRIHLEVQKDDLEEAFTSIVVPAPPETVPSGHLQTMDPEATLSVPALTESMLAEMRAL